MIVGTAGHIDHGKTTLVRALTGVDTDRLPEEKRRGISIELGYAYLPLPASGGDPGVLGFIDVPGHEKFVPTMLAGASGIDFALLVIAADDGPMPQTREHLAILDLLGVAHGAVALTKVDAVGDQRVAEVTREIAALLAPTRLTASPIFPVAAPRGLGIDALRKHVIAEAAMQDERDRDCGFRLAVDRAFTLPGAGTVVTGTVFAGRVAVGDSVLLADGKRTPRPVRVRSLHAQNRAAAVGFSGQRCALNLVGVDHGDVARGDWLLGPTLAQPTQRLDLRLTLLADAPRRLTQGAIVHLHHAASHTLARVALLDEHLEAGGLPPGADGLVQLITDAPLFACHGDRIVLRDAAGQATIAGGTVLDPFAPTRHRRRGDRRAVLAAQETADPRQRLAQLLDSAPLGLDLAQFAAAQNLDPLPLLPDDAARIELDTGRPGWAFSTAHWTSLGDRILARLAAHHAAQSDEVGVERERLRRMVQPALDARVFLARLDALRADGGIARSGSAWHLPEHRVELAASEQRHAEAVLPWLLETPFDPPWVRDIAARLGIAEDSLRALMKKLAAQGRVHQVVRDLFYAPPTIAELARLAAEIAARNADAGGRIRAAEFRDATGLGRKRAIQILEFFDRVGYTRRIGDGRTQAHVIRGEAPATLES